MPSKPAKSATSHPRASASPSSEPLVSGAAELDLARLTLQAICRDTQAPAAARAQSARTLLELAGALKTGAPDANKPAVEMSLPEIEARLAALASAGADTPADT